MAGWVWRANIPDVPLRVEALVNDEIVGLALADLPRPDLAAAGKGLGNHGFRMELLRPLMEGEEPLIRLAEQRSVAISPTGAFMLIADMPAEADAPESGAADVATEADRDIPPHIEGFVEHASHEGATGWVWSPDAPDMALAVEAVLDDQVIGSAVAEIAREDLVVAGKGTGRYGFILPYDDFIAEGAEPIVRLTRRPSMILTAHGAIDVTADKAPVSPPVAVEGYIELLTHDGVSGWVWREDAPDMVLSVEAVLDGTVIGAAQADILREDVAAAGKGSGRYGFALRFFEPIAGDVLPIVRVVEHADIVLNGATGEVHLVEGSLPAPTTGEASIDPAQVEGYIELLTRHGATGWVWRSDAPDAALTIEAVLNGEVVSTATADVLREDLRDSGHGTGRYGFVLKFPAPLGGDIVPQIRLSAQPGVVLGGASGTLEMRDLEAERAGQTVSAPDPSMVEGYIELVTRHEVSGWVWRADAPDMPLTVEAELDGQIIGAVLADGARPDLAEAGKGGGYHGFTLRFDRPLVGRGIPQVRLADQPSIVLGGATGTIQLTEGAGAPGGAAQTRSSADKRRSPMLEVAPELAQKLNFKQFYGHAAFDPAKPSILVVAHAAAPHLFGSERSFIDMVRGISALGYNVYVVLPRNAPDYTNMLRRHAVYVSTFQYGWWKKDEAINPDAVALFSQMIRAMKIKIVHSNTIMLRECLRAARQCDVQSMVHVRELIDHDDALIKVIGASCDDIIEEVRSSANWVIGNSDVTSRVFNKTNRTFTVYNTVDLQELAMDNPIRGGKVRFGLVSSNIPKKGLADVVEIARLCETRCPNAEFLLIGPESEAVKALKKGQVEGVVPKNILFPGYAASPVEAMAWANVILSLSHFAESFGRTVLEAMAAQRPVIAYAWGAIPELVEDGVTGHLIPYRTPAAAVAFVERFCADPALVQSMGAAGLARAHAKFGRGTYVEQMRTVYDTVMAQIGRHAAMAAPIIKPAKLPTLKTVNEAPKIAYFCWHFPVPSETFVLSEVKELIDRGYDVMVFCRQSPHKGFDPGFSVPYERVASMEDLARRLVETGRTIVHAHFVYPTVTDMVWPACEKANIPFTFMAHAQDIFKYSNDEKNRLAEIGQSPLCVRMFTLSQYHLDFVISRGFPRNKVVINPNAVDTSRFTKAFQPGKDARSQRRIIAVHRFVPKKGLDLLIKAAPAISDLGVRIELYGYGDCEAEYRALIDELKLDNVFICGKLDHDEIPAVMQRADLFACPSVRTAEGDMDGIPTSIVESMAAGVPVLTTNIAGIPDLVVDGITGIMADPDPQSVADAIRRYYTMPANQVAAMIQAAQKKALQKHDVGRAVDVLTRVWENRTVDIVIVSWNGLKELAGVIDRIQHNTSLPYHLIVCDNQSSREAVADHLDAVWDRSDNVTIIHNNRNAMVGPGTNSAVDQGVSDVVIYVCGKEGFSFSQGWEIPFVHAFKHDPMVGLAGTVEKSPTYLTGADYPKGIRLFDKFRNKSFATDNPDRPFGHVQGGLFGMRRAMYDAIGGFSEAVPHDYTDVEYSFFIESCGWKMGPVENIVALFNKTRPSLSQRFDETVVVAHPCMLDELDTFAAVRAGKLHHCNICDWFGEAFTGDDAQCPSCESGRNDRTLYRWLGESAYMFRRLPCLSVGLEGAMEPVWAKQFQGPRLTMDALLAELYGKGRLPNKDGGLHLILVRVDADDAGDVGVIARELKRLLKPQGGTAIFQLKDERASWGGLGENVRRAMMRSGFVGTDHLYTSWAVQHAYSPMLVFTPAS
ncbi:glycosyltransferase [Sphingobium rhizovicinum]|uniref:Glycosyltransferase n=1 Tax=Sphingobium rhizovicinum TaxID=432308 RepID=A0ABV7NDK5_9SPHN